MQIKSFLLILQYYLFESLILSVFIWAIWRYNLQNVFRFSVTYFNWVGIVLILKLIINNVISISVDLQKNTKYSNDEI